MIPSITTVVVGRHPETKELLRAYGVYKKNNYRDSFEGVWVRDADEAKSLHLKSVKDLQQLLAVEVTEVIVPQLPKGISVDRLSALRDRFRR